MVHLIKAVTKEDIIEKGAGSKKWNKKGKRTLKDDFKKEKMLARICTPVVKTQES